MLELTLKSRMYAFIRELQVVEKNHILSFFRNERETDVEKTLQDLLYNSDVFTVAQDTYSTALKLPMSIMDYADRLRAIDVLCKLSSDKVRHILRCKFPTEIFFMDNNSQMYDIAVFADNISSKAGLIAQYRQNHLLDFRNDTTTHIAVVPNESVFRQIEYLGWSMYATIRINPNGPNTVTLYELTD